MVRRSNQDIAGLLLDWYARCGRSHLPWRTTRDPYRVLVSEFMLQQTQVDRVLPKYELFLERFPDVWSLARASTADVLRMWKGLGYNSRAVRLKQIAQAVCERFGGLMPSDEETLRTLPGIGPYTVAAIRAFAFDCDDAATDTNVRRVTHRVVYGLEFPPAVTASALDARARELVPAGRGHDWNSATMDLGATICTARAPKCLLCPLQPACAAAPVDAASLEQARSGHSRRRSPQETIPFEQTTRYARGRIIDRLRELPPGQRISLLDLHEQVTRRIGRSSEELHRLVKALERDGLVSMDRRTVALQE
ncbi:MAG TPA: A/G-specific adenine glycosylase [Candidatus Baltobacteraceae bacterium]|nr:A/G-specific adenine glycosylase [Candidatus Baltobacteraceae bacterium]